MIKAIETRAFGCRFRSRLEARWATFFECAGVKWYYEHEGYELPSGRYLPDFWLPELSLHVEVKPDGVCEHAESFRSNVGPIAVTHGLPDEGVAFFGFCFTDSSGGSSDWEREDCIFGFDENRRLCLFVTGSRDRDFYTGEWEYLDRIVCTHCKPMSWPADECTKAAREARFGR